MQSLYISDVAQALNYDIVNGSLNYMNYANIEESNYLNSSKNFSLIDSISKDKIDKIEENFYKTQVASQANRELQGPVLF